MPVPELILASQSPRRKDLLGQAGIRFRVHVPAAPELDAPSSSKDRSPSAIVKRIAAAKARACAVELKGTDLVILSADTLVFAGGRVLGKPRSENEARSMLGKLSGKTHTVYTGVTCLLVSKGKRTERSIAIATKVQFFPLTKKQIDWYVSTGEPMDKAGAYGAQGHGAALVRAYSGSYTNVVGLPLGESLQLLEKVTGQSWLKWQLEGRK